MVLKFECALESSGGLIKAQISGAHLQNSDSVDLGETLEFAFLSHSQVMLLLLALLTTLSEPQNQTLILQTIPFG